MRIEQQLTNFIADFIHPQISTNILIAYSGGVDSHVLLYAAAQLRKIFPQMHLKAIHIHHGLLSGADAWALHCQQVCHSLNVELQIVNVKVQLNKGDSVEEAARQARYQAFAELLPSDSYLLTAHHADDQAETCLLQFLRGAGLKGLAAMPMIVPFAAGFLARPFLNTARQTILTYASKHQFCWIEDDSNHDIRFTRNFLRYKVMPELRKRWPNVNQTIMRVANNCAEADELLKTLACQDMDIVQGTVDNTLSVVSMRNLSVVRQKNILREWLYTQGFLLPSAVKMQHIITDVINARSDANSCVKWRGTEIRRYQDNIYALKPLLTFNSKIKLTWDCKTELELPANLGKLRCTKVIGKGLRQDCLQQHITVRFRQGGEVCRLPHRHGTHKLKKLFQEWQVPPWQRNRIPLIYVADELAVIIGYAICAEFTVHENELGVLFGEI